ncbi:alpha/beta hydrolase family protein [Saccharothrix coeruleofusca]|uniref:Alpha/beta hydrolase n=1 Tax=Saccharothrix coeruleofusca TaxID=33919 RepID=A0A918EC60_9PSEU|nr:DUF6351 family protein [Saccharothrix coeruleofusca]GGP34021.1 alpha/beta hydrolase [Saccharothrix coeruleofusca]
MKLVLATALVAGLLPPAAAPPSHVEGVLPSGAAYVMDVPRNWNRTALLYSHGYTADGAPNPAQNAPSAAVRTAALDRGYALIGSSYAETGWAVEHALPDQLSTVDEFAKRFGKPRRTIAWGASLGGMITTGLAERHGHRFDGALAMCGVQAGAVASWNSTLDAVFAVRTLLTTSTVPLVDLPDRATALASAAELVPALDAAQATARGRARIALASALHNIPAWTTASSPEPAPDDYDTAQRNQYEQLHNIVHTGLSGRQEAETRAGGNMSWNTGVDYSRLLARSAIRPEVEALYARAGLSLAEDLATLAGAPRISADQGAVAYMTRNLTFTGRPRTPLLTIHTTGDAPVPVQGQRAYADAVRDAGHEKSLRQAFVHRGGHCAFTTGEMMAALAALEERVDTGRWPDTGPNALNAAAARLDPGATHAYRVYRPAPHPRPFDLAR